MENLYLLYIISFTGRNYTGIHKFQRFASSSNLLSKFYYAAKVHIIVKVSSLLVLLPSSVSYQPIIVFEAANASEYVKILFPEISFYLFFFDVSILYLFNSLDDFFATYINFYVNYIEYVNSYQCSQVGTLYKFAEISLT